MGDAVGTATVLMLGRSGLRRAAMSEAGAATDTDMAALARRLAAAEARLTALEKADVAAGTRLAALEARPEEAAHFTASAKLPAITVLQPVTLTLTGLVPAVAGDRVRKGEAVLVEPAGPLPAGANPAAAWAPADDTVMVQLTTGINLAAGTAPIGWNITVLR